jgi:hypothetical protein
VSTTTSFDAVGAFHSIKQDSNTGASLYQGDATTVKAPGGTVSYNPRDGIFTLAVADSNAGVSRSYRFQDPGHRNDGGFAEVPNYSGYNYLTVLDDAASTAYATFFYQRPGAATTTHVTLAGYVRTSNAGGIFTAERGAFVFGTPTLAGQVPTSGSATYNGGFIGTMITSSSLQWLAGSSALGVNFATGAVTMKLTGTTGTAFDRGVIAPTPDIASGSYFEANGGGVIDLIRTGGFTGKFDSVCFIAACGAAGSTAVDFRSISQGSSTAGASSIDGMFYGPNAVNVGGSFRVVGGVPNTRVDILGAFTGAKQP